MLIFQSHVVFGEVSVQIFSLILIIGLLILLLLRFKSWLGHNLLLDMMQIFSSSRCLPSQSLNCVSKKFLMLTKSSFSIFTFMCHAFCIVFMIFFTNPRL